MARETGRNAANGGNSFNSNRRGFLGSTGLAAMGAIIGAALPHSGNVAGIPRAHAQADCRVFAIVTVDLQKACNLAH